MPRYDYIAVKSALLESYRSQSSFISWSLMCPNEHDGLAAMCENIAARNVATREHPTDSLVQVLRHPEVYHGDEIEDAALVRFIKNSLIVSMIQIGILEERGMSSEEAIDLLCDNGFFARLSAYGRFMATDGYRTSIETLKEARLWTE